MSQSPSSLFPSNGVESSSRSLVVIFVNFNSYSSQLKHLKNCFPHNISIVRTSKMADNFDIEEYLEEQVTKPVESAPEEDKKSR